MLEGRGWKRAGRHRSGVEAIVISSPIYNSKTTVMETYLWIGIVTVALQPGFVSSVNSGWSICTLSERVIAEFRLIYLG